MAIEAITTAPPVLARRLGMPVSSVRGWPRRCNPDLLRIEVDRALVDALARPASHSERVVFDAEGAPKVAV
jgi:hypothetical protein